MRCTAHLIHYNTVSGEKFILNAVNMAVKSCVSPLYLGKAAAAAFQRIKPTTCAVYVKYLPCLDPAGSSVILGGLTSDLPVSSANFKQYFIFTIASKGYGVFFNV